MTNKVDEITTYDRVVRAQKTCDFLSPEWWLRWTDSRDPIGKRPAYRPRRNMPRQPSTQLRNPVR
jgi:hypothetical protein